MKKYNLCAKHMDGHVEVIKENLSLTNCIGGIKHSTRKYEKEGYLYLFALPIN
jgi:hypothetical protein